jgi:hypothetical protein
VVVAIGVLALVGLRQHHYHCRLSGFVDHLLAILAKAAK